MIPKAARKREKYNENLQESHQRRMDQERSLWAWFRRAHPETHKMISVGSKHAEATLEGDVWIENTATQSSDNMTSSKDGWYSGSGMWLSWSTICLACRI